MIKRHRYINLIKRHFKIHKVCVILGASQCGKTMLAKDFIEHEKIPKINVFNLDNYSDLDRIDDPLLALSNLQEYVVIDGIQNKPDLFPTLKVLSEEKNIKFLILSNVSKALINKSATTLAGMISYIEMGPFSIQEVSNPNNLWIRGGFPQSYLAKNDEDSFLWRQNYIKATLEQSIPRLGFRNSLTNLRKFLILLCDYHGKTFNASKLGKSLGISYKTAQSYLNILESMFIIRVLQPWHENLAKKQVKTPKIYFKDSGIYHALLGLSDREAVEVSPKKAVSWEGFALEQIITHYEAEPEECYFWSSHNKSKVDLLIIKNNKRIGFIFHHTNTTNNMKAIGIAEKDLELDHVNIISSENNIVTQLISLLGINMF